MQDTATAFFYISALAAYFFFFNCSYFALEAAFPIYMMKTKILYDKYYDEIINLIRNNQKLKYKNINIKT